MAGKGCRWADVQNSVDVHYVGFTGGGEGAYVQYACNISNVSTIHGRVNQKPNT
jgi:hypothetical protein